MAPRVHSLKAEKEEDLGPSSFPQCFAYCCCLLFFFNRIISTGNQFLLATQQLKVSRQISWSIRIFMRGFFFTFYVLSSNAIYVRPISRRIQLKCQLPRCSINSHCCSVESRKDKKRNRCVKTFRRMLNLFKQPVLHLTYS